MSNIKFNKASNIVNLSAPASYNPNDEKIKEAELKQFLKWKIEPKAQPSAKGAK